MTPVSELPIEVENKLRADAPATAKAFLAFSSTAYFLAQESFQTLLLKDERNYEALWTQRQIKVRFCAPYEAKELGYLEPDTDQWRDAFNVFWCSGIKGWSGSTDKWTHTRRKTEHEEAAFAAVWDVLCETAIEGINEKNPFDVWFFTPDQLNPKPTKTHQETP